VFAFFAGIGHNERTEFRLWSRKDDLLGFAVLESHLIMLNFILLSYAEPDLLMTGAAVSAVLCGIVLMGGRSVVGRPLRLLSNLCRRSLRRETVVYARIPGADRGHEHDTPGVQHSLQRVA